MGCIDPWERFKCSGGAVVVVVGGGGDGVSSNI